MSQWHLKLRTQLMLAFMATLTLILSTACWYFYQEANGVLMQQLRERLTSAAGLAAISVDHALHSRVRSKDDPAYFEVKQQLCRIHKVVPYIRDIYTIKPINEKNWQFLVDAADPKDPVFSSFGTNYQFEDLQDARNGLIAPTANSRLYRDEYGVWLSGYAPLPDAVGKPYAVIALDMSAQSVIEREKLLQEITLGIFLFGLAAAAITSYFLAKFLNHPIEQLAKATSLVGKGDLKIRVPENRHDELGQLARSFNTMLIELEHKQEELSEQERVLQELATARKIQQAMLPSEAPPSNNLNIDFYAQSASEVGGDYFDFLPLDEHQMAIVIGDVTGHGVPAALLMAMVRSCLHTQVLSNHQISDVMQVANNTVYKGTYERRLMTFFYSILNTETGILRFANAGHLYPIHYKAQNREIEQLATSAYPLGVKADSVYPEHQVELSDGDLLVFYSDGIIEAQNAEEEQYGFERFEEAIASLGHLDANEIVKGLLKDWRQFTGEGEQPPEDDVTVVAVKFKQLHNKFTQNLSVNAVADS